MASNINSVVLVGRLTHDCEVKPLSNTHVCNFSLAITRRANQNGNWVDEPHYFNVELYGNLGPALQNYLLKGKQVAVEGSLRQHRWETPDGQKRSKVSIVASNVQLLGSNAGATDNAENKRPPTPQNSEATYHNKAQENAEPSKENAQSDFEDDIPF